LRSLPVPGSDPAPEIGWIAALGAVAVAAATTRLQGPRAPLTLRGRELPSLCAVHALTGHRCPSCGMTRGVLYMARADVRNAMRANRAAPLAFAVIVVRAVGAIRALARAAQPRPTQTVLSSR
jgi:Protein of unknown function (DUF2752)